MRFSAGLSLALLSAATHFARGFSLKPHATNNYVNLKKAVSLSEKSNGIPVPSFRNPIKFDQLNVIKRVRGGTKAATTSSLESESSFMLGNTIASLWGAGGVVMILAKSIKRIVPIALEPFGSGAVAPLSTFQLGSYIAMCLWFAYVEGYKGFQLKFSPLVVARSQTLKPSSGTPFHHTLLAPFYSMGLFHATKKRKIVSWCVSIGVGLIVAAVKKLPYPWRNIVDAGVVVGLTWGSLSIAIQWVKAVVFGIETTMDPALPKPASE